MTYRAYLHEDLRLIQRYFPGAKTVALCTPFDLTVEPAEDPWKLLADDHIESPETKRYRGLIWNQ
ncbi:MAG TPA: hypothetical protein VGM08_01630 [Candidatus Saccharimonadales bacterium]|jgi:hypothetical protein